jgi:DNA-binding CsgD family transcriptional regulator
MPPNSLPKPSRLNADATLRREGQGGEPALLERDGVLADMEGMARHVAHGAGQLLLLCGEAGVGKSATVHRFVDSMASRFQILAGCCDPLTAPRPLGPLIDMLAQVPDTQVAGLRAAIDARNSESIYAEVLEMFGDGSQWICVIEDAHWADGATLDLLRFIARRIDSLRLLLMVSYRDDELGPEHPFAVVLGDLSNHAALNRIRLSPLSVEAVRALAAGSGINAEQLHRLTGGNPFYVTEVLAAAADGSPGGALPRSVSEAVRGRLARLSASGREAAEAAAVCGPRADIRLIEQLRQGAADGLRECMRAGVLVGSGPMVRFRHELARRATLEQIPDYDRRELHRRALLALAKPPIDPDTLAPLVLHAENTGDDHAVACFGPAAAERAAALGAHADAAELYALSLRHACATPDSQRVVWLERHALASYLSGRLDAAARSLREAAAMRNRLGDRVSEGDDLRRLSNVLQTLGRTSAALESGRRSVRLLEPLGATPQLGWSLANFAALAAYRYRESVAVKYAAQAIAVAKELGDPRVQLSGRIHAALVTVLTVDDGWGELEAAWRDATCTEEMVELGGMAGGIMCWVAAAHADVHRGERYVSEAVAFCRERNLDIFELVAAGAGARIDVYRGQWDRAVATSEDILTRPGLAQLFRIWPLISLAIVRARRGQRPVMRLLDEAIASGKPDELLRLGAVWAARAEVAWLAGDDDAARAEAERGLEVTRALRDPWLGGHLLRWTHLPGSSEASTRARPDTPYFLEITGDWRAASEAWKRRGCTYDAAIAQLGGDIEAVETALGTFRELGARAAVDRARQRLAALRGGGVCHHRADTRADPHGLTRREREILELLAVGYSDAYIAGALFISQRTVNNHVHAILGKLGVHNRTQAAAYASNTLSDGPNLTADRQSLEIAE